MDERVTRTIDTYEDVAEQYQSLHGDRADVAPIVEGFRDRIFEVADGRPRARRGVWSRMGDGDVRGR